MIANETDLDPELALLGEGVVDDGFDLTGEADHGLRTTPIITGDVCELVGSTIFPQRALYGRVLEYSTGDKVKSPKLFTNTNAPFSGIICGVQGSGKSHSTSVLLESCLVCDKRLGTLPEPLSALLFYFDTAGGTGEVQPCEAAYLSSLEPSLKAEAVPPDVVVLVPVNYLKTMRQVYSRLPQVKVEPLHFAAEDLSADRLLAMMKVDQDQDMPLYMECIMAIVRGMDPFSYEMFRMKLKEQKFAESQKAMLNQRLAILDSCLEGGNACNRVSNHFKKGQLTIIDLSAPFMDASSACGFFDIILGLFIQEKTTQVGKLVVLDEAHKYLTNSGSSSRLTESLLSVIRQQRHLGTRVLISTQEPTVVPPKFLDLCSFVIAHRFSSPKWLDHLKDHVSVENTEWRSKVITLRTGEAMIFAPAALVLRQNVSHGTTHSESIVPLGQGYLKVRSRVRITADGGRSVLAAAESLLYGRSQSRSISSPNPSSKIESDVDWERAHAVDDTDIGSTTLPWTKGSCSRPCVSTEPSGIDSASLPNHDNTPFPSLNHIPGGLGSALAAVAGASANSTALMQSSRDEGAETPQGSMVSSLASSELEASNMVPRLATGAQGVVSSAPRFRPLVSILNQRRRKEKVFFSELGSELKKLHPTPYVKLKNYLMEAKEAGIVIIGGETEIPWVQLIGASYPREYPREYHPLVSVMENFLYINGERRPRRSDVATEVYRLYPGTVGKGKGKFGRYVSGAQDARVVARRKHDRLELTI